MLSALAFALRLGRHHYLLIHIIYRSCQDTHTYVYTCNVSVNDNWMLSALAFALRLGRHHYLLIHISCIYIKCSTYTIQVHYTRWPHITGSSRELCRVNGMFCEDYHWPVCNIQHTTTLMFTFCISPDVPDNAASKSHDPLTLHIQTVE